MDPSARSTARGGKVSDFGRPRQSGLWFGQGPERGLRRGPAFELGLISRRIHPQVPTSATILDVSVPFWHLYNLVTQLGGWSTVWANEWVGVLCSFGKRQSWMASCDIHEWIQQVCVAVCSPWEVGAAVFGGKGSREAPKTGGLAKGLN